MLAPVVGRLISSFGQTTGEYSSFSKGILFISRPGAQVISPIQGKVVFSGSFRHYGNMVILQQNDYYLALSGLQFLNSQIGQTFLKGEPIGRMPIKNTPKLYLELWHGTELVDPSSWFSPHVH